MTARLTITSKGQITLRKDVLAHLGVAAGDRVDIDKLPDGRVVIRPGRAGTSIEAVFNAFGRRRKGALTIEEMRVAAGRAGEERGA